MKIVVLQDWLRGGGTERQTVFLARAFAAAGHGVALLTFRPGGVLAPALAGSGVDHRSLQTSDTKLDWLAPGVVDAVQAEAPAIVLCMGRMANCYAGTLQRALPAAAVVATVRTGKHLPWLYRRSLRAARAVVANSEYIRELRSGGDGRWSVIPNALLFPELFDLAPAPAAPLALLNVAQFRRGKGQAELLRVCAELPAELAWVLEMVGDGPTRRACEKLTARLGLAQRVFFRGWCDDPQDFYRRAGLAVLTSDPGYESLPNFLVEAQAAGVPVVAYNADGAAEAFVPGRSGVVVPARDRATLVKVLAALLQDRERCAALGAAGRAYARDRFSPPAVVEAYLGLFRRLATR